MRTLVFLMLATVAFAEPKFPENFATEKLVAWCIVPFDAKKRGPEERARMLKALGIARCAYDWRAEHVAQFEQDFARFVGAAHCVGLNSGTSALHLALLLLNIKQGDEVITTPHTFVATSWAISSSMAAEMTTLAAPVSAAILPTASEWALPVAAASSSTLQT